LRPSFARLYDRGVWSRGVSRVVAVVALTVLLAVAASAVASPATKATVFHAFTAAGAPSLPTKTASGYCWTGSLAAERGDAWRCFVGNEIHDPCFSSSAAHGIVLCPNEQLTSDTEIHLTRPLPTAQADNGTPSIHDRPWLIEVGPKCSTSPSPTNCIRCEFAPGAQPSANGKRLNYECSGALAGFGAFGLPNRNVEPWTISVGKDIGKGSVAFTPAVAIVQAWM